jgi:hypothetical protein
VDEGAANSAALLKPAEQRIGRDASVRAEVLSGAEEQRVIDRPCAQVCVGCLEELIYVGGRAPAHTATLS